MKITVIIVIIIIIIIIIINIIIINVNIITSNWRQCVYRNRVLFGDGVFLGEGLLIRVCLLSMNLFL